MTEEVKEYWTLEDLESLTETVQEAEVEHQGKYFPVKWCELVESEEPKYDLDDNLSEEEKQEYYMKLGKERCLSMILKASEKDSDYDGISAEQWAKLPSTLKFKVQNTLMGVATSDFQSG
tara:strand:- start:4727 stop:5086 length:360 start_codon:yes stop_codon:yes gene_type:complete